VEQKNENNKPRVERLVDMVEYQRDAVVSRALIDKPSGTLTLFAFDEGQGLSEHTAPYDAMVYILNGEALITISGEEYRLSAGDSIIMPANIPHALYAIQKYKMLLSMIRS